MELIKEEIVFQWKIIEVVQQTVKIGDKQLLREIARRSPWVRLIICDGDMLNRQKNEWSEVFLDDWGIPTTWETLSTNEAKWLKISKAVEYKLLLTKEFRREINADDYRLPWGKVFDTLKECNEHRNDTEKYSLLAAKRECEEETGLVPSDISLYYISKVWTTVERDLHYYVIKHVSHHDEWQHLELGENIVVEWKTVQEIKDIIKSWGMSEDRSVGVLLRYLS